MASGVWEIECHELIEKGICGVILDLDNTLLEWRNDIVPTDVEEWVRRLKQTGISACIVSNCGKECWMIGSVSPEIKKNKWPVVKWILRNKWSY